MCQICEVVLGRKCNIFFQAGFKDIAFWVLQIRESALFVNFSSLKSFKISRTKYSEWDWITKSCEVQWGTVLRGSFSGPEGLFSGSVTLIKIAKL